MTTNAGRALLRWWTDADPTDFGVEAMVAAIEAEKEAEVRARLAEEVEALPSMGTTDEWDAYGTHRNAENVERAAVIALIQRKGAKA